MGRYRMRTWLRGLLPGGLASRIPKGHRDCGDHAWYREDEATWRCAHCEVGVSATPPWPPIDTVVKTALSLRALLEAREHRELDTGELELAQRLSAELVEALREAGILTPSDAPARDEVLVAMERVIAELQERLDQASLRMRERLAPPHTG